MTAATWSPADEILEDACRDVLQTIKFGRIIGRTIPTTALAARLQVAADDAAGFLPDEPQHLGRVWPADASLRATRDSATTGAGEGDG